MKNPFRSILNLCAFGLLLLALYLNFVDLNKPEPISVRQWTGQHDTTPRVTVTKAADSMGKQY
ncbi:hypothetical protein [Pseudocnuella soli]|uniref:hypothetical protein n=1 Tax=Pseudocnuella soli TaxID=2502779 RepID=UPI00104947FA|nr:hypothetical protein [Pseudocnuella soli]